jgi:hypothetical protein
LGGGAVDADTEEGVDDLDATWVTTGAAGVRFGFGLGVFSGALGPLGFSASQRPKPI